MLFGVQKIAGNTVGDSEMETQQKPPSQGRRSWLPLSKEHEESCHQCGSASVKRVLSKCAINTARLAGCRDQLRVWMKGRSVCALDVVLR
jgi:hypothetical protein